MLRDNASLLDIARFSGLILEFTESMSQDEFNGDIKTQAAVLYYLTIIGEAVKRISMEFRSQHPEIAWKQIAGMRDKVTHQYDRVKLEVVWQAVQLDIPDLIEKITPLLPIEEESESE
jgi:uncharacterized protein with HEPN domain